MKGRLLMRVFLFLAFLPLGEGLFAFGKKEIPAADPLNAEWTLCITAFDVSALPATRQIMGDAVARNLAASLQKLDFRIRGDEEYAYYRDYAWAGNRSKAAKALETKRADRDLLIYKGDRSWKYKKDLKAADKAILLLEEDMASADATVPVVEKQPALKLTSGNVSGTFPNPPKEGDEYRFCADQQKADAFLAGSLFEYHERIYLSIKMYTLFTGSYSFEDFVLFSSVDFEIAVEEIYARLAAVVSGTVPSGILVHAAPLDAMILIDDSYAGSGETEVLTRSPGHAEIALRADNHIGISMPLELNAGELTELFFTLTPLGRSAFGVDVPGSPGSRVFLGGLYVGETPLAMDMPTADFAYISVETQEGEVGSAVYKDNALVRGSAQFVRMDGAGGNAIFSTSVPVSPDDKRVNRSRRGFYGAYGAFWVILPAALIIGGIAGSYVSAYNYGSSTNAYSDYSAREDAYNRAITGRNVSVGSTVFWASSLGVTFFMIGRYLYISNKAEAMPIVKGTKP